MSALVNRSIVHSWTGYLLECHFTATRLCVGGYRMKGNGGKNEEHNIELRLSLSSTCAHVRKKIWPNPRPSDGSDFTHDL